jgi:CcmD family protein
MRRKIRARYGRFVAVVAGALCCLSPALVSAQEFEKVTGAVREELPAGRFVAAAYGFIWIAVLVYVVSIARGLGKVRKDLGDLKNKLERSADRAGPRP